MNAMRIIRSYAVAANTTADVLRSKRLPKKLFNVRQHIYGLLRSERKLSYPQIGRLMGRSHSTIFRALNPARRQATIDRMQARRSSRSVGASMP